MRNFLSPYVAFAGSKSTIKGRGEKCFDILASMQRVVELWEGAAVVRSTSNTEQSERRHALLPTLSRVVDAHKKKRLDQEFANLTAVGGHHFGLLASPEWTSFWTDVFGEAWRPPHQNSIWGAAALNFLRRLAFDYHCRIEQHCSYMLFYLS